VAAADPRVSAACLVVFVCTGNTCRSPLAAALCRKLLAERIGCSVEELPDRGWLVTSAGLAAAPGMPAADQAVAVAQARGADLTSHSSQPLSEELARQADLLIGMTHDHVASLRGYFGDSLPVRLLDPEGEDVPDPIGQSLEVYDACARHLEACIVQLIEDVDAPG
jgi:protein-tyrosine phosphatase